MNKKGQEIFKYDQQKHDKFVKSLLPITDFDTAEDEQIVLLHLVVDDNVDINHLEKQDRFFFSVINEEMARADYAFFSGVMQGKFDFNENYYSPYAYGLVVENTEEISALIQNADLFKEPDQQEIPCKLLKMDKENEADRNISILKNGSNGSYVIPVVSFFSASPFRRSGRTLVYNFGPENQDEADKVRNLNEIVDKIKKLDIQNKYISPNVCKNNSDIYSRMKYWQKFFPSDKFIGSIKVYNVGQGFCAYLREENGKKRILFDIGLDQRFYSMQRNRAHSIPDTQQKIIEENYRYISKFKPSVIILSHWDIDHLLGICQIEEAYLPKVWIVPDMSERKTKPKFLLRVVAFLLYCRKMLIVGKELNGELFWENEFIALYKGQTLARGKTNANNNQGLIAVIRQKIIFPGDCFYEAWPTELAIEKRPYSFLIVPHHGGEAGNLPVFEGDCAEQKQQVAIVSYGENNSYGHPKIEYITRLREEYGYSIQRMPDSAYIIIQINYNNDAKSLVKMFCFDDYQSPCWIRTSKDGNTTKYYLSL